MRLTRYSPVGNGPHTFIAKSVQGSSGSLVGCTGSGGSDFPTIWQGWHVRLCRSMSLSIYGHHNFERMRCFVFVIRA